MSTVVVFDSGSGNTHSVVQALRRLGARVDLTADRAACLAADALVLPGVGSFAAYMHALESVGGVEIIRERVEQARPLLGICVGHQVLFSEGVERGRLAAGLAVYPGTVRQLPSRRRPHMGWNELRPDPSSRLFEGAERYYFVHSYAGLKRSDLPETALVHWAIHDSASFVAAVEYANVLSTQFHPEKSGAVGLRLLRRWLESLEGAP